MRVFDLTKPETTVTPLATASLINLYQVIFCANDNDWRYS